MPFHNQAAIAINNKLVVVDIKMAHIIHKLNSKGFVTTFSCQGGVKTENEYSTAGYVSFGNKSMSKKDRKKVEKILGLSGKIPTYKCYRNGRLMVKKHPKYPYWEYWQTIECGKWVIRFKKI